MPAWLTYSLLVVLLWGLWAFLPKLATRTLDASSVLFYQQVGPPLAAAAVLAAARYKISVVVMLTALYPVLTILLSIVVLKERIGGLQWLGILFALAAIALMSAPNP